MLEATIAIAILVATLSATAQLAATASRASRTAEDRMLAAEEASNVLERLFVLDWDELTSERASQEKLSDTAGSRLHDAELEAEVSSPRAGEGEDSTQVKRILVRVRWRNLAEEKVRPVELSAWRSRREPSE